MVAFELMLVMDFLGSKKVQSSITCLFSRFSPYPSGNSSSFLKPDRTSPSFSSLLTILSVSRFIFKIVFQRSLVSFCSSFPPFPPKKKNGSLFCLSFKPNMPTLYALHSIFSSFSIAFSQIFFSTQTHTHCNYSLFSSI